MITLLSVNVAMPETVEIQTKKVLTGIYKQPVSGRIRLNKLNLQGDGQADLAVHGGEHQAVYCYPVEHYAYWQKHLNLPDLPYGFFGENFTLSGLLEDEICMGDILQIGDAITGIQVQVTHPRIPCFKFGHKIGYPAILDEFLQSGKSGFYLRVLQMGDVAAGDAVQIIQRDPQAINIRTALGLYKLGEGDAELLKRALSIESLSPLLNNLFTQRLQTS
jgi:MOSC domain-containing protein YiiM